MTNQYSLKDGTILQVSDTPLGSGGEGEVFDIHGPASFAGDVAKVLYKDRRTSERLLRIGYMVDNPPPSIKDDNDHVYIIWPKAIIYENNEFVGFIMSRAEGIDMEELCRMTLKPELDPQWQRFSRENAGSLFFRLNICFNIAAAVAAIHAAQRYVIGDLKPENIKVRPNGLIAILDLDSCQISDNGKVRFKSKMNTALYNPPEQAVIIKQPSWDWFILGVIFYEILCGIHPFTGTTSAPYENHNSPEQKIKAGLFPFGSKASYFVTLGSPHNNFRLLRGKVQELFVRCFDQGITDPSLRPTPKEWMDCLTAKPTILALNADKKSIIAGVEIELSWDVEGADSIEIDHGVGAVTGKGTKKVRPQTALTYTLTAVNEFGKTERQLSILSFPTPVLKTLLVPMPDFASRLSFRPIWMQPPVIRLNIQLPRYEEARSLLQTALHAITAQRPIYKPKHSFFSLAAIFDRIKGKTSL